MDRPAFRPAKTLARCLAAVVVLAAMASAARADDPRTQSRAAFVRGVDEAHHEHYLAARDAFLEAYRLFPHPSILLNLGVARMHTGEYLAAEGDLSRFLTDDGGAGPEELANARATLEVVRKHIGTIRLRVANMGARATLDGTPLPLTPGVLADVRAVVGPGHLRLEADGCIPLDQTIVVSRDEPVVVDRQLSRSTDILDAPSGPVRRTTLGWGLVGGGAVVAIVGVVAGVEAISLAHDYNTPGQPEYQQSSTKSSGVAWRTSSDLLFLAAIGLGAAGTYFLVKPLITHHHVDAWVGPGMAGVGGRF